MKEIQFNLTREEGELIRSQSHICRSTFHAISSLMMMDKEIAKLCKRTKSSGNNKGQYAYYINNYVGEAIYLINRFKIQSIADLGCGTGDFISAVSIANNCKRIGFEIEEKLVELARQQLYRSYIYQKDLFDLKYSDISGYKGLFLWEPIADSKKANELGMHLASIVDKHHYIFYQSAGSRMFEDAIGEQLVENVGYFKAYKILRKTQ